MAQTILCDLDPTHGLGAWLVTNLENGDSLAYCNDCYANLMVAAVEAMAAAEAMATDEAALDRIQDVTAPPQDAVLEGSSPAQAAPGAPETPGVTSEPTNVVKRGTSRSRKVHEANRRARAQVAGLEVQPEGQAAAEA